MNASTLVQKIWNYCYVLRDDFWATTSNKQLNFGFGIANPSGSC